MTLLSTLPRTTDVLVIGGGPGGLYSAERLARGGFRVTVCEEHATVGDPVHCTGILASESFDEFDLPRETRLNDLSLARFVSPTGIPVEYSTPVPLASLIDRGAFDRALADRAVRAGVDLCLGRRIVSLSNEGDAVHASCGTETIRARMAILACGANYALQRRFGLGFPSAYLHTAQCELPASTPEEAVELFFGHSVAPEGFAWAAPVHRPGGRFVRIGVMASHDALGCYRRILERLSDRWGLDSEGRRPRQKILPLGVIRRTYDHRMLVVGDAAGLVKPTTGGGIYYSVLSASIAADVAAEAIRTGRVDAVSLAAYERRWRSRMAGELRAQRALRQVVTRLNDRALDSFFELARTDGVMPIVRSTARFNNHRALIRALFRHPPARKVLFRSMVA
jgi:geranylgeranyl reductase family protein